MRKLGLAIAAAALVGLFAGAAGATHKTFDHGRGNTDEDFTLTGPHFTLNIIGTNREFCDGSGSDTDCFSVDLTGSNRHSIFVALGTIGAGSPVKSNIYLQEGDFKVCDGNAFDETYDCSNPPVKIKNTNGATFRLPCNETINQTGATADACTGGEVYTVWARALGQPGGLAEITTCVEDSGLTGNVNRICSLESAILLRNTGKNSFKNETNALTSFVAANGDRFNLFDDDFQDFLWEYDNKGLRNAQLRFYCTTCD